MTKIGSTSILVWIICISKIYCQSFPEFDSLKQKAYAAYGKKDYTLSLRYFEKLLQMPAKSRPEFDGMLYYDISCTYSLNGKADEALGFLEKCFKVSIANNKANPISAAHIAQDSDLDFIRNQPTFFALLKKYYSTKDYELIQLTARTEEISYSELLVLIKQLSENNSIVIIKNKIIYWKKSGDSIDYNQTPLPIPNFSKLKTMPIVFRKCSFRLNFFWDGDGAPQQEFPLAGLEFHDCRFYGRFTMWRVQLKCPVNNPFIFKSCLFDKTFTADLFLELDSRSNPNEFDGCTFREFASINFNSSTPLILLVNNNTVLSSMFIGGVSASYLGIQNNRFERDLQVRFGTIEGTAINNNKFKNVIFSRSNLVTEFDFKKNILNGKLALQGTHLPESTSSDIDWSSLNNFHLGLNVWDNIFMKSHFPDGRLVIAPIDSSKFMTGERDTEISDDEVFKELMGLYSVFLNIYKNKNDIESYNGCFIQVK